MEYDVTKDREFYIGGSDVSVIMGISPFKTRYELLCEKTGLKENPFDGNIYTAEGQRLEPLIREYINNQMPTGGKFEPNRVIDGDIRCHTDGFNGYCVLEIKTTSKIHETLDGYKMYLVQLLLYMDKNKVNSGLLAVYHRTDIQAPFDPENLKIYEVAKEDYITLLEEIYMQIDSFRKDLQRLKENPLLSEEDFLPCELIPLSQQAVALECQLAELKAMEKRCKDAKQSLFEAMTKYNVKSWDMPNGTKITRVDATAGSTTTSQEFDLEAFQKDNPELYKQYMVTRTTTGKGRAGYVRITLP
jgi:hypothetical protein